MKRLAKPFDGMLRLLGCYGRIRRPSIQPKTTLLLENLEDRCLPSRLVWAPEEGGTKWMEDGKANWINKDNAGQRTGTITAQDILIFDPLDGDATARSNEPSINDNGPIGIAGFNVATFYSSTITLAQGSSVTINGSATLGGLDSTVTGPGVAYVAPSGSFSWTAGTILNTWFLNADGSISGGVDKELGAAGQLLNYASLTWSGGGIVVPNGDTGGHLYNAGTFEIQTDAQFLTGPAGGTLVNDGIMSKVGGLGTTSVGASFVNRGVFGIRTGIVSFTRDAEQSGADSSTALQGGDLATNSTYYIAQGLLQGAGTITGHLSTDFITGGGIGIGRIRPGLQGIASGTISVTGNYTQTQGGELVIDIAAAGSIGTLNVQNGTANLSGTLTVHRHQDYRPRPDVERTFMRFGSVTGDFGTKTINGNPWDGDLSFVARKHPEEIPTEYRLVVAGPNMGFNQPHNGGAIMDALVPPGEGYQVVEVNGEADLSVNLGNATLAFQAEGNFTFTPALNTKGETVVQVLWQDGDDNEEVRWVRFVVENEAPWAEDFNEQWDVRVGQTTGVQGTLLDGNGIGDTDSTNLTVTKVNGLTANVGTGIATSAGGVLTINADGSWELDPNDVFNVAHTATFTVSDGPNSVEVSFSFTPANTAPYADDYWAFHSAPDDPYYDAIPWLTDDQEDAVTVRRVNGQTANVGQAIDLGGGVYLTLNADGTFSLDTGGQTGYWEATFTVWDTLAESGVYTLSLTVDEMPWRPASVQ